MKLGTFLKKKKQKKNNSILQKQEDENHSYPNFNNHPLNHFTLIPNQN